MSRLVSIPADKRVQFEQTVNALHLMHSCIGWPLIDRIVFYPVVPKRGGKRLRKKKAKALRLQCIGELLREAGMSKQWGSHADN